MADDYSPRYVGDTSDPLQCAFTDHSGAVYPITGATNFVMRFKNTASGTATTGTGTFTITDGPGGKGTYTFGANDVAVAGIFEIQPSMTLFDGTVKHWDWRTLEFKSPL